MADFHQKPFDEGTLTKLDIFELYTREWLPVFLARESPYWNEIHLFDFFCGPGEDQNGKPGSPFRILNVLKECHERNLDGWSKVKITVHFFDASPKKVASLKQKIECIEKLPTGIQFDFKALPFKEAIDTYQGILSASNSAKLLFIDQCGIDEVNADVFRSLVSFPHADFLFFISSSTFNRFREHPNIKQKIVRPDDYYHVHRAVVDFYRDLIPRSQQYFLAPFAIKKKMNIYGLIFGTGHPLGLDKFLKVAWEKDKLNGEADYDINRENVSADELLLGLDELRPSKLKAFERELASLIEGGHCDVPPFSEALRL